MTQSWNSSKLAFQLCLSSQVNKKYQKYRVALIPHTTTLSAPQNFASYHLIYQVTGEILYQGNSFCQNQVLQKNKHPLQVYLELREPSKEPQKVKSFKVLLPSHFLISSNLNLFLPTLYLGVHASVCLHHWEILQPSTPRSKLGVLYICHDFS